MWHGLLAVTVDPALLAWTGKTTGQNDTSQTRQPLIAVVANDLTIAGMLLCGWLHRRPQWHRGGAGVRAGWRARRAPLYGSGGCRQEPLARVLTSLSAVSLSRFGGCYPVRCRNTPVRYRRLFRVMDAPDLQAARSPEPVAVHAIDAAVYTEIQQKRPDADPTDRYRR